MLITRQLAALINGVSQQPAPTRLPSQCEAQVNCTNSVVDGVRKRGPCEHRALLTADHLTDAYLHVINRDVEERYVVLVTETGIRVFGMDGVEKTVTAPAGWDYLDLPADATAQFSYVAMTVADYTFVLNKTKTVGLLGVGDDQDPPSDDYWWLNRPLSDAAAPMPGPILEPEERLPFAGGGNSVVSSPTSGAAYVQNPTAASVTGTVQTLQDLPVNAANGAVYKIAGTDQSGFSSYYVIKQSGAWFETVKPGLRNLIDADTMPHALVRQGDGTFLFGPFAWTARRVGDEQSNPHPTFVGRQIRDVFFERNRLGFAVDENAVLSRVGDYGTFHRLTVTDYLEDEVIDVATSERDVNPIEFVVPVGKTAMLFSGQTQFALTWAQTLTGRSISLDVSTKFPMASVRPDVAGTDVYMGSENAGWVTLREYYVAPDSVSNDASDITKHVPTYIPAGLRQIIAAAEYDQVFVLTDGASNRIYNYTYYWQTETEKAQSAWSYWEFADDVQVVAGKVLGPYLYLLLDRADGTHLERIPMFYGSLVAGLDFQVYLDRRVELEGTYSVGTGVTSFELPYALPEDLRDSFRVVLGSAFVGSIGSAMTPNKLTWSSETEFTIEGDYSDGPVACGLLYTKSYTFSRQFALGRNGDAILSGRLQMKSMSVHYTDTSYFRAEVKPYGAVGGTSTKTSHFPVYRPSLDGAGLIGEPVFRAGVASFGVEANSAEVTVTLINDSHLGSCFNSAEWTGFYSNLAGA